MKVSTMFTVLFVVGFLWGPTAFAKLKVSLDSDAAKVHKMKNDTAKRVTIQQKKLAQLQSRRDASPQKTKLHIFQAVEKYFKKYNDQANAFIAKDPKLSQQKKSYEKDVAAFAKEIQKWTSQLSKKNQKEAQVNLARLRRSREAVFEKHKAFADTVFRLSGLGQNTELHRQAIMEILDRSLNCAIVAGRFQCKFEGASIDLSVSIGDYLTVIVGASDNDQQEETTQSAPIDSRIAPPFPYILEQFSGGMGSVSQNTSTENGGPSYFASSSIMYAGNFTNMSGLGHFFTVPNEYAGLTTRYSAKLPDTTYSMTAFGILGASGASGSSAIDVLSENEIVCSAYGDHGFVIAPIIWYGHLEGTTPLVVDNCDFAAPDDNTEIVLNFYSNANSWAALNSFGTANVTGRPEDLRMRLPVTE